MKNFLILFMILLLTGCSNYNDISNIAVIDTIMIEKEDNYYNLYVKVLASNNANEEQIYTETCNSIATCFDSLNNKLMKRLYLTHTELLILSNNFEKNDYDNIFNFFLSQKSSRNSFTTIVLDTIDEKIFEYDTLDINNILDLANNTTGIAKKITLSDIFIDILNYKISYIPIFKINEELEILGYKEIYEENKVLDKNDSIAVNIVRNDIKNLNIIVNDNLFELEECLTINKVENNKIIIDFSCKYKEDDYKESPKHFIKKILNNFLSKSNNNYLKYLVYKYENKKLDDIKYSLNINMNYMKDDGGETFG